jgi:predicted glycogen debranching enzyme
MAEIVVELTSAPVPDQATINVADSSLSQAISETTDRRQNADWHRLAVAARQFMVARHGPQARAWTASVIAGYPWFGDWGRDTMISLPGLMLCTGRLDEAESTLACFAKHLKNGLVPNLFDDYGSAAHYNTVDASLWFVHAAHALHLARLPDTRLTREIVEACRTIIAAYRHGTDFDIRMDQADGLIVAGSPATQLTWMDAARDGVVFTPRFGKAVEINALWHNALLCMSELTEDAGERNELIMLARRVAASFRSAFWWEQRQCLHDCLTPSSSGNFEPDGQMRPNQIFAVSLPFSALNEPQHQAVVKAVGERLLTPFGLRTLDRDDPNYKPRYEGTLFERDAAYHNGTVWPWLIGAYCDSLLRVERFSGDAKRRAHETIRPLIDEMRNAAGGRCVGQIAEVYDGDPPHRPSGCPAQAWSVAEVLRILTMIGVPHR